jgi:peroxiredoxin
MLPLHTKAPDFSLRDTVSGEEVSLADFEGDEGLLVMFLCNHCPFVIHVRDELVRIGQQYRERGIGVVAISSNDVETHPQDGPRNMKALAEEEAWNFPYLFDEDQTVAKEYRAACTPDFFVFDGEMRLYYRGHLDDSRPGNEVPVAGSDLRHALDAMLLGKPAPDDQRPSLGCNIKWKPGNEPEYAS